MNPFLSSSVKAEQMSNVSEVCQSVMLRFVILHKLQQLIVEQFRVTTSRGGLDANVRLLDLKVCKNELFLVPPGTARS